MLSFAGIKVINPGNLPKSGVGLTFCAFSRVCNIKGTLLIFLISFVIFTSVTKVCGAEELVSGNHSNSDNYGLVLPYQHVLFEHDVALLVINVTFGEICLFLWKRLSSNLYFV